MYAIRRAGTLISLLLLMILATSPGQAAHAQEAQLFIDIQPQSGPPGTTVTITGRGAPPLAAVQVLFAPFSDLAQCRAGRDAQLVAEITADREGQFIATHLANRMRDDHAGNTYLAKLNQGPVPRPSSDLECFTFGAPGGGQYFPETGHVIIGRFLEYWRQNGGLDVFGYPLTDEFQENGRTTQYFERARFEWFPENERPYDVLLGHLGIAVLEMQGIDWRTQPTAPGPAPGCLYFEETQHNVCNQQRDLGFLNYWWSHGLQFENQPGITYAESLALFGYPVTEPYRYTNESGDTVQVQWFERARFEWHPDNPDEYKVLLGRLGAQVLEPGVQPSAFSHQLVAPESNGLSHTQLDR